MMPIGTTRRGAIRALSALPALAACAPLSGKSADMPAIKHFTMLVCKPGVSQDEFRVNWLGMQGQLARDLPGIRGLVLSEAFGPGAVAAPESSFTRSISGFAQAWFPGREALAAAIASDAGTRWAAGGRRFVDYGASRAYLLREYVAVAPRRLEGAIKRTLLLVRKPGTTHDQFLDHWLTRHVQLARGVPGLLGAVFNPIIADMDAARDPWRDYDGITETWWQTGPDDLGGKPASPQADAWLADADNFLDLPRCRTITSIEHVLIAPT